MLLFNKSNIFSRKITSFCYVSPPDVVVNKPIISNIVIKSNKHLIIPSLLTQFEAPFLKNENNENNKNNENVEEWSYTTFIKKLKNLEIESMNIYTNDLHANIFTKIGTEANVQLTSTDNILLSLINYDVDVSYIKDVSNPNQNLKDSMFEMFFQFIGFIFLIRLLFMFGKGTVKNPFSMSQEIGKLYNSDIPTNITFNNVAGVDNAKEDLLEVVDFLKDKDKYITIGARIPKGILLIGPPGTGKTLLARAVAGEADVPFFSCSASEFIEMFAGLGASRIRELFKKAQDQTPCIIFIDEIDAIGKKRSNGIGEMSNDERDQTINQLLTEMDGFDANSGVIVIAATNRPELLDEALIRPGRFDRKVYVDLPNFNGRKAILDVHLKNKNHKLTNLDSIAKITIGFSGADLENLCNEAAIYTARNDREYILQNDINYIFDKTILGSINKTSIISDQKKLLVAYHEAGHALLGILLGDYDNISKISIVPRGESAGVTYFEPNEERIDSGLYTREYLENQLIVILGGRIAEEIKFGNMKITTGAAQDFKEATEIATDMVTEYGFNEKIGPLNVSNNIIGDAISPEIAEEVKYLIEKAYIKGTELIEENEKFLNIIANALIEKENLTLEDLIILLEGIHCEY